MPSKLHCPSRESNELRRDELRPMAAEMGNHLCGLFCFESHDRPRMVVGERACPLRLSGQGMDQRRRKTFFIQQLADPPTAETTVHCAT